MKIKPLEIVGCIVIAMVACITIRQAASTPISGTNVAAPIVPFDTADTYPSHINNYGKGGPHFYLYTSDLRSIPDARRERGMLAWINEKRAFYQLYSTPGHYWRPFTTGGAPGPAGPTGPAGADGYTPQLGVDYFDGRPAPPPLFCNLSGGTRAITYDQAGLNPSPAMQAYGVQLWVGGSRANAIRTCWVTGPSPRQIFGSGCSSTFTPSVMNRYSANWSNNYVTAYAIYSTIASAGGKRICTAGAPIAVTKIGQTGLQGPPGTDATVTEPAVITAFSGAVSDNAFQLRPASNSGTVSKFEVRDYLGNVRDYFNSNGYLFFKTANGYSIIQIQTDGTLQLVDYLSYARIKLESAGRFSMGNSTGKSRVFFNSSTAKYLWLRGDGMTTAFGIYSGGQYRGREGLPAANGYCLAGLVDGTKYWTPCEAALGNPGVNDYCLKSSTAGVRSWGSCGSGSGTPAGSNRQIQYNNSGGFAGTAYARYTGSGTVFGGTVVIR